MSQALPAIQNQTQSLGGSSLRQENAPSRPEILHFDGSRIVWRDMQRPDPASSRRAITWDIQIQNGTLMLRSDLHRQGMMSAVDFREVRGRLDDLFLPEAVLKRLRECNFERLRQSLMWQRNLDAHNPHISKPEYRDGEGWKFILTWACNDPIRGYPLDMPVLRPASDEMMVDRWEERQWILYHNRMRRWAAVLGFYPAIPIPFNTCRARLFEYQRIRECRELFSSSPPFAALFCTPGMLPELDDIADANWQETVARLARLPRWEWMDRLGLPPTRLSARLFARLDPRLVSSELPLVREVFADAAAQKRLADVTTRIPGFLLRYFLIKPQVLSWPLVRQLCRERNRPHWSIETAMQQMDFFRNEPFLGPRIFKLFRRARSQRAIEAVINMATWLRMHWDTLLQPSTREALGQTSPPLPSSDTIRCLNRPIELIELSFQHGLCLEKFIDPIVRGEYALYRIDLEGQFAVAGIHRQQGDKWELEQIQGSQNVKPSDEIVNHFSDWIKFVSHDYEITNKYENRSTIQYI